MGLFKAKTRRINLALQGGGAHGAFTWGVLDRLLEDEFVEIDTISATSAGAVNAVALASGLEADGRQGARAKLTTIWEKIYKAGVPAFLRFNPLLAGITQMGNVASASMAQFEITKKQFAQVLSPYEFNPLGLNPLAAILKNNIDFARLRRGSKVELMISATEMATGRAHIFRRHEMTADMILASACLPSVHQAVRVGERYYWDGGFSANPDLLTVAREARCGDTVIVMLNPARCDDVPTGAQAIAAQVNRITFNQPLLRDIRLIEELRCTGLCPTALASGAQKRLLRHRFHLIEAAKYTARLSPQSKLKPDWDLFVHLFEAGRAETESWLGRHRADLGRRASVDLARTFLAPY